MKTAGQLINRTQAGFANKRPNTSRPWSEQTEKFVVLAFTRMADLYGPKCKVHGLEIRDEDGEITEAFKLWCRKCDGLTPKEFKHGVERLEGVVMTNAQTGVESWPPSYAEFIGYATQSWETAAHKPYQPLALPDKAAQERAQKAGARELDRMKNLFATTSDRREPAA